MRADGWSSPPDGICGRPTTRADLLCVLGPRHTSPCSRIVDLEAYARALRLLGLGAVIGETA